LLCLCCWVVLLVRQSYVHFFLDKKVPKKSRLCIVSPACSQLCLWSGRGRTDKARIPRTSKLALVRRVLDGMRLITRCFCGRLECFSAQTLICFTGILAFPVLNATRSGATLGHRCGDCTGGGWGRAVPQFRPYRASTNGHYIPGALPQSGVYHSFGVWQA
jgi:hypothetical protein